MSSVNDESDNSVVGEETKSSVVDDKVMKQVFKNENAQNSPVMSGAPSVQDTTNEAEKFDDASAVTDELQLETVAEEELSVVEHSGETETRSKTADRAFGEQTGISIANGGALEVAEESGSGALMEDETSEVAVAEESSASGVSEDAIAVTEETGYAEEAQEAISEADSVAVSEDFVSEVVEEANSVMTSMVAEEVNSATSSMASEKVNSATSSVVAEESKSALVTEEVSSAADTTSETATTYQEETGRSESFTENLTIAMSSGSGTLLETSIKISDAAYETQEALVGDEGHSVETESTEQLVSAEEEALVLADERETMEVANDETSAVANGSEEIIVTDDETLVVADLIEATVVTENENNEVIPDPAELTEVLVVDSKKSHEDPEAMNLSGTFSQETSEPPIQQQDTDSALDIIKMFAKKYIEFLEEEWQRRRSVWKEGLKHCQDKKTIEDSAYSYETFVEAVGNGKIALQVPFILPEVTYEATAELVCDAISVPETVVNYLCVPEEAVSGKIPQVSNVDAEEENVPLVQVPVAIDIAEVTEIQNKKDVPLGNEASGAPAVAPIKEIYKVASKKCTEPEVNRNVGASERYDAVVNGRTIPCSSLEHKIRVENAFLKLTTIKSYAPSLKEMTVLPGVQVLRFLDLEDFKNCRLVSQSWNAAVINSDRFLGMTTFVLQKKALRAMATLENSKVRWQNLRCSILPSMKLCPVYDKRFLTTLRVTAATSRREPLTNSLTTVILEDIDIDKQQLVRWIQSCKRLNYIEVINCTFLRTSVSVNMDKANTVLEKVQTMKFSSMDTAKLADALRFFLPATRHLHTLEIFQKNDAKGGAKSATLTVRKRAEEDVTAVLCPTLKKNSKTLKNIAFEFASARNYMLQQKIVDTLQASNFQLNTLVVRASSKIHPLLKIESCAL